VFIPDTDQAVTGTDAGDILVWDRSLIIEGIGEQNEKRLIKIVTFNQNINSSINILTTVHDQYLVCGNSDGTIRFYDFYFKVAAWFEDLNLSTVKSISFSKSEPKPATTDIEDGAEKDVFKCSDFLVTDDSALVCMLQSTIFEEIEPAKKKGRTIFYGLKSAVSAIAVHPTKPLLAIAGQEGFVLLWDYMKREDPILNNYDLYQKKEEVKDGNKDTYSQSKSVFTTMTFTPDGSELLIGRSNGFIEVMDPITGKYIKLTMPLKITENKVSPITGLIVSRDG
jgi:WD40 repeat protein